MMSLDPYEDPSGSLYYHSCVLIQIELTECGVPVRLRAVVCGIVHEGGQTHAMADSMEGMYEPT